MPLRVSVVALLLGGCGSAGGAPFVGLGDAMGDTSADAGASGVGTGARTGASGTAGTTDTTGTAAQTAAPTATAFPLVAYSSCRGSEQSWGDQFLGVGKGPEQIAVSQPSPGHFVVTVTDPTLHGTTALAFTAVSDSAAIADEGQTIVSNSVPHPQEGSVADPVDVVGDGDTSPVTLSIESAEISTQNEWTYFNLLGTSEALVVSYSVACPVVGGNTSPAPASVPAGAAFSGTYTVCHLTEGPAATLDDGYVRLAASGDSITATVALGSFAQATLAFTADSSTSAVLAANQQASTSESSTCDPSTTSVSLDGGSLVVDGGVLFLSFAGASPCADNATLQVICSGTSLQ